MAALQPTPRRCDEIVSPTCTDQRGPFLLDTTVGFVYTASAGSCTELDCRGFVLRTGSDWHVDGDDRFPMARCSYPRLEGGSLVAVNKECGRMRCGDTGGGLESAQDVFPGEGASWCNEVGPAPAAGSLRGPGDHGLTGGCTLSTRDVSSHLGRRYVMTVTRNASTRDHRTAAARCPSSIDLESVQPGPRTAQPHELDCHEQC